MFTKESQPGIRTFFWVGLSIILMVFDQHGILVQRLRAALFTPLSVVEYSFSLPATWVAEVTSGLKSHVALVHENRSLAAEQLLMKAQVQRLLAIESENNQLKALLRSSAQVHGKVLIAQLLAIDSDPFVNQVILDKGSRDGIFIGQPVLDADGVMGKIIEVGPLTSRVLLINDTHSGVPVQNTRNGLRAIAMGDSYTRNLHLVNIPQTVDINVGDVLVTSGLGEHYPAGYPVGRVVSIKRQPGFQFAEIDVQPNAHSDRARQVLLVWPDKTVQQPVLAKGSVS